MWQEVSLIPSFILILSGQEKTKEMGVVVLVGE